SAFPTPATTFGASRLRSYTLCRMTTIVSIDWAASRADAQTAQSASANAEDGGVRSLTSGVPHRQVRALGVVREGPTIRTDLDLGRFPIRLYHGFGSDQLFVVPLLVVVDAVVIVVFKRPRRPLDVPRDGLSVRGVRRVDHGPVPIGEPAGDVHREREVLRIARQGDGRVERRLHLGVDVRGDGEIVPRVARVRDNASHLDADPMAARVRSQERARSWLVV